MKMYNMYLIHPTSTLIHRLCRPHFPVLNKPKPSLNPPSPRSSSPIFTVSFLYSDASQNRLLLARLAQHAWYVCRNYHTPDLPQKFFTQLAFLQVASILQRVAAPPFPLVCYSPVLNCRFFSPSYETWTRHSNSSPLSRLIRRATNPKLSEPFPGASWLTD